MSDITQVHAELTERLAGGHCDFPSVVTPAWTDHGDEPMRYISRAKRGGLFLLDKVHSRMPDVVLQPVYTAVHTGFPWTPMLQYGPQPLGIAGIFIRGEGSDHGDFWARYVSADQRGQVYEAPDARMIGEPVLSFKAPVPNSSDQPAFQNVSTSFLITKAADDGVSVFVDPLRSADPRQHEIHSREARLIIGEPYQLLLDTQAVDTDGRQEPQATAALVTIVTKLLKTYDTTLPAYER